MTSSSFFFLFSCWQLHFLSLLPHQKFFFIRDCENENDGDRNKKAQGCGCWRQHSRFIRRPLASSCWLGCGGTGENLFFPYWEPYWGRTRTWSSVSEDNWVMARTTASASEFNFTTLYWSSKTVSLKGIFTLGLLLKGFYHFMINSLSLGLVP